MRPVDSGSLSQRMQRVVGDPAGHGSIERLLRLAARLCGGSYAAVSLGAASSPVVIAHGTAPTGSGPRCDSTLYRSDGTELGSLTVLGLAGAKPRHELNAVLADVTALIVEQLEMRRDLQEEKFRQLIERAPDAVVVRRGERVLYCNQAFLAMHGFTAHDEIVGHTVLELVHPDAREELRQRVTADDERPVTRRESRALHRDGRTIAVEASTVRLDFEGAPAMLAILRDVSERKRLEQQLLITERMASVGTLAAGVAHEINNPLAFVLTNVDFARGQLPEGEAKTALEEAQKGAERVQRIVQSLKILSSAEDDRRDPIDVHHPLELALSMAMNEIRLRAKLRREYQKLPVVEANESRLGQVFLNLIVNAVHAIPAGAPSEHSIVVATGLDPLGRVFIEVRDSGAGIPPDVLPRIFDPFFTTKPLGVGTGLGLAICHGAVASLGGSIAVESEVGRGTTFRVLLPVVAGKKAVPTRPPPPPAPKATRRARVLVVDDEPMIGSSIRRVLAADHDVEVTTSGAEALQSIDAGARYDVILCDLMMPEMTGMELHDALQTRAPDQADKMVFLTGGTFTDRAHAFVEARPTRVHHKPLPPAQLRDIIARMLA